MKCGSQHFDIPGDTYQLIEGQTIGGILRQLTELHGALVIRADNVGLRCEDVEFCL